MGVRKLKPTTPGQRHKIADDFSDITTSNNPEKSLLRPIKKSGGRNNQGINWKKKPKRLEIGKMEPSHK